MDTPIRPKIKQFIATMITLWSLAFVVFLSFNIHRVIVMTRKIAESQARSQFHKDQAFRFWASSHGGIYVPVSEQTQPNPYLNHLEEQNIQTPSGKALTLMNPAYMVRQMNELYSHLYGIDGHITSLKPLRPQNKPDQWEREALIEFEQGTKEAFEFTEIKGAPFLRLMQPMVTKESCLKCHRHQGYKVGDIRGGVAISLPLTDLYYERNYSILMQFISMGSFWVLKVSNW